MKRPAAWPVRRWKPVLAIVLVLLLADAGFVAANRPDTKTDAAASAAISADYGDDPPAGADASCKFTPQIELVVWQASYDCTTGVCGSELSRMTITHVILGGWSFETTSGGRVGDRTSGDTAPSASTPPHTDPGNCQ